MNNAQLARTNGNSLPALPSSSQARTPITQATMIEQARAEAEIKAQVVVAQERPRDIEQARTRMRRSCDVKALADAAFYTYSRGGSSVNGPTVQLARELASCWGNFKYGVTELSRTSGESQMKAWAWDLETNTLDESIFVVSHVRDAGGKKTSLDDERDIYENNANLAARRQRERILSVLPVWFVEEAKDACHDRVRRGDGEPLNVRIDKAIASFRSNGVAVERLEAKHGPRSQWTEVTVANLHITYKTIGRGETTVDEQFPKLPTTSNDLAAAAEAPKTDITALAPTTEQPTAVQPEPAGHQPQEPQEQVAADAPPPAVEDAPEEPPAQEEEPPGGFNNEDPWDGNAKGK